MKIVLSGLGFGSALAALVWYLSTPGQPKNSAFVFVKPHAVTPAVIKLVRNELRAKGLKIKKEGALTSEIIDQKKLIDQHYYAIASKATLLKPSELNVPEDKFQNKFGLSWKEALSKGIVFNALDLCKELSCTADELGAAWASATKHNKVQKFGGGFYCGLVELPGKKPVYVINAFFIRIRSSFTAPGRSIHYYIVEWDASKLSWGDFRGKLLGPTDPKTAPIDSLRGKMYDDWESLGLPLEPNMTDNGVHASASPFEAMAERMNWLETPCFRDSYCKALVRAGMKEATIKAWSVDPQVSIPGGKKGSLFDALEDLDSMPCLNKALQLQAMQGAGSHVASIGTFV